MPHEEKNELRGHRIQKSLQVFVDLQPCPEAGEAGGQTVYTDEQLLLKRITFHAGCSQPFEVAITFRGETEVIKFDPFSGYVLTPLK